MKKTLTLVLALLFVLAAFAGCTGKEAETANPDEFKTDVGNSEAKTEPDLSALKTMSDVYALEGQTRCQTGMSGDYFVYAFQINGEGDYYQAVALISEDISEDLWNLDWMDPEYEEKETKLTEKLEVVRCENLIKYQLTREEMDALVGKTWKELYDTDEWYNTGWNLIDWEFWNVHGPYAYNMVMEGYEGNPDDFDEEDMMTMKIKSVEIDTEGYSDLTWVELDDEGKLIG